MFGSRGSAKSSSSTSVEPLSLAEFREVYAKADGFCKEVQSFVEEAGIPAMNELRYAGYHLLQAIDDKGKVVEEKQLYKAKNHALRATYEAGEAGILAALDQISTFKTDYKSVSVSSVIPNYTEILQCAENAKNRVVAEREHNDGREIDRAGFMEAFKALNAHCHALDIARDELNKIISKERRDTRRFVIGTGLAVIAIFVTIALAVWQVRESKNSPLPKPAATSSSQSIAKASDTVRPVS